jgi:hypothetical protein
MPKKNNPPQSASNPLRHLFSQHRTSLFILFATFGTYFVALFSRILYFKEDGLYAGHVHVWGDWALHVSMAQIFALKEPKDWFAYHPYYAYGKFTYGFLSNMISGLLMRTGLPLPQSFTLPSILYTLVLLLGMYAVFYLVLRTQKAALTAITLFFLSSGPGFLRFLPEWLKEPTFERLIFPLRDYSRLEQYQWLAGNWVAGMLMPQRSFLLGMAVTVWSMAGFLYVLKNAERLSVKHRRVILACSGLLAGILPITHMHSFIVLVIVTGLCSLVMWKYWKDLIFFVVPAGILSSILYLKFISGGIENPEFMQLMVGWTAPNGLMGWVRMWNEIWGAIILVALFGALLVRRLGKLSTAFLLSFWTIFALGNIILFQPIQWDNSKLFMWAYFGLCGLATLTLQFLWRRKYVFKAFAVVIFLLLSLTGAMELARLQRIDKNSYRMATREDMQLGELVRQGTDPRAVFLTNPTHDHPVMEWGARSVLMGYPAWAWNFGFLYRQREQDIHVMFKGGPEAARLLKKYHISYVSMGPGELFNEHANEAYFMQNFPVVIHTENYRIYDVRSVGMGE